MSIMMVSLRSRPICERSYIVRKLTSFEELLSMHIPLRNFLGGYNNSRGKVCGAQRRGCPAGLVVDRHTASIRHVS